VKRPSIEKILKELQSGKAVGSDGIPNEFLKYGGDIMITSLAGLCIAVTDLETLLLSIVCRSDLDSTIRATSSAYNNAFIIWEAILTPILCSESISVRSFIITEKSDGEKIHPCFTPLSWLNHSDSRSPRTTLLLTVLYSSFSKRHTFP
jgi:hypothetical protein